MITSVRLQNWASFGAPQTAPLEAITVLVGANNAGKSNFLRVLQRQEPMQGSEVHRPATNPTVVARSITAHVNAHIVTWDLENTFDRLAKLTKTTSTFTIDGRLSTMENTAPSDQALIAAFFATLEQSRLVHLKADAIRPSNQLTLNATVQQDGAQLAAVIARWILELPERLEEFNAILRRCLPEMKRVHAPPDSKAGFVRLFFEQKDGERFDASMVSDGVLLFAALIAHALEAPKDGLVLIEEPERGLHPRRLVELLDVLRTLVETRKTQFVLATHSPALLTLLRDEPEAILLFRRTDAGTEIRRLSDVPELSESLGRADPGEMLANGVFNEGFRGEGPNRFFVGHSTQLDGNGRRAALRLEHVPCSGQGGALAGGASPGGAR